MTYVQSIAMKGVNFLFDERGERKAVLIDLKKNRALWEDFYDSVVVREREDEPRETLREAKHKILANSLALRNRSCALSATRDRAVTERIREAHPHSDRTPCVGT